VTAIQLSVLTILAIFSGVGVRWAQHRRWVRTETDKAAAVVARLTDETTGLDVTYWCTRAAVLLRLNDNARHNYRLLRSLPTPACAFRQYTGTTVAELALAYRQLPLAAQLDLLHGGGDPYAQAFWCALERREEYSTNSHTDVGAAAELWTHLPGGLTETLTAPSMGRRRTWAAVAGAAQRTPLSATEDVLGGHR
jgi:hypothetical protein